MMYVHFVLALCVHITEVTVVEPVSKTVGQMLSSLKLKMNWAEDYIQLSFCVCHKVDRSLKLLNAF